MYCRACVIDARSSVSRVIRTHKKQNNTTFHTPQLYLHLTDRRGTHEISLVAALRVAQSTAMGLISIPAHFSNEVLAERQNSPPPQ